MRDTRADSMAVRTTQRVLSKGFDFIVDAELKVYGVEGLRIADASILPRVTTGNTMAPCIIIGERAADLLLKEQGPK